MQGGTPLHLLPGQLLPEAGEDCQQPFSRKFLLHNLPGGGSREVVQLHTNDWPDLTAPEEPR